MNPSGLASLKHPLRAMAVLGVVIGVGFPAFLMLTSREKLVGYVSDDAYYYFNVAMHIGAGDGPTADGVTTTTGFHPLYAFMLAGMHWATDPSLDGFVDQAVALNALCSLAAGAFLYLAGRQWWGRTAGLIAALLWLANPHGAKIMGAGLEGCVYAMMLSLFLWRLIVLIKPEPSGADARGFLTHSAILGVCGGLVMLSRTDASLIMPLVALIMLAAVPTVKFPVRVAGVSIFSVIALGLFGMWLWYAWSHTGHIVQGSAAAKMEWRKVMMSGLTGWQVFAKSSGEFGWYVGKAFVKIPALKWVLSGIPLLIVLVRSRDARAERWLLHALWIIPIGLGLAYATLTDRPRTWYYVPGLVTLTIFSAGAATSLWQATKRNALQSLVVKTAPLLAWVIVAESAGIFAHDVKKGRSSDQEFAIRALDWLKENVEPGTTLGCWHSGIVQYYTPDLTIINMDGLANNEILPVLRGEKTMNAYWDEKGIEYVLGKPNTKMENFAIEWNDKKLIEYGPPGFGKKIRRIVHKSRLIEDPSTSDAS
ncbi:MAG: hypothetical protein O7B26_08210 [Planctomycetota bacterium]|nr:hypothetical protein [Planctomycetota bacterium]